MRFRGSGFSWLGWVGDPLQHLTGSREVRGQAEQGGLRLWKKSEVRTRRHDKCPERRSSARAGPERVHHVQQRPGLGPPWQELLQKAMGQKPSCRGLGEVRRTGNGDRF